MSRDTIIERTPESRRTIGLVDVWTIRLQSTRDCVRIGSSLLSPDESMRASRFVFEQHRNVFIVARAALRRVLSLYLDASAAELSFDYDAHGKLLLAGVSRVQFNAWHQGDLCLLGISFTTPVGIDVEEIRPMPELLSMAQRFFSTEEYQELLTLNRPQQQDAFFRCWTRKEAYVKTLGEGLSTPLDSFRVSMKPDERAAFLPLNGNDNFLHGWTLHDLEPTPGYLGAVALRSGGHMIKVLPILDASQVVGNIDFGR